MSPAVAPVSAAPPSVIAAAYAHCEQIAKREAKNFYYAFRVLPEHKRLAMCAIYAFMRRADDIADDESLMIDQRRTMMSEWLTDWRTGNSDDLVFTAVRDTQVRFQISDHLLEQLVEGTTMDLYPSSNFDKNVPQTYKDLSDLYQYCYLVASVVGLVCIRIFGYTDPAAEKLAEETGIAFQLTNILRDVKEDAERGRIYLPLDLLAEHGLTTASITSLASGSSIMENDRSVLRSLAAKARMFYASADRLLPLIDRDSRAALWVLVAIYSRLLDRIEQANYDVFTTRASVPTATKLGILALGAIKSFGNRGRA